jgi:hypothetical protein
MDTPTTPAPAEKILGASSPAIPGTIGFDLYLALFVARSALTAPRVPQNLGKIVDYQA